MSHAEDQARYRAAHPERVKTSLHASYIKHREVRLEQNRTYRLTHLDRRREIEERRAYLRAYKRAMVSVAGECLNFNPYPELREVAILLGQLRRAFKTQKGAQS